MDKKTSTEQHACLVNRRDFIKLSSSAVALLANGTLTKNVLAAPQSRKSKPKNILFKLS